MTETKAREKMFDIAKGLAFIAVIWGHMFPPRGMWFVYGFHLQVFFFISGWFLNVKKPPLEFFAKKIERLVFPYVTVGIVVCILLGLKDHILSGTPMAGAVFEQADLYFWQGTTPIGPMWFLPALFVSVAVVYILAKPKYTIILLPFAVYGAYVLSKEIWLPFFVLNGVVASGFVGIGYLSRKVCEKIKGSHPDAARYLFDIGFVVAVIIWVIFQWTMPDMIHLFKNEFPRGIVDYLGSMAAVYAVLYISKRILSHIRYVGDFLCFFGENTMLLICIHEFDTAFFLVIGCAKFIPLKGLPLNAVLLFMMVVSYSLIVYLIRRLQRTTVS